MKLNKKGFTMVELLAAVTILGIVTAMAVTAYTKYQEKVRYDAYEAMEKSAYSAAEIYIQDKGIVIAEGSTKTIQVSTLVDGGYLPNLEDPRSKGRYCHTGSKVQVTKVSKNSGTKLESYKYVVTIKCSGYTSTREDGSTGKEFIS